MRAEVGVRGATTYTGTHSGHFQLNPVHRMSPTQRALLKRLNSPGGLSVPQRCMKTDCSPCVIKLWD